MYIILNDNTIMESDSISINGEMVQWAIPTHYIGRFQAHFTEVVKVVETLVMKISFIDRNGTHVSSLMEWPKDHRLDDRNYYNVASDYLQGRNVKQQRINSVTPI